jgi:sugar phosphate isomerase/epimerase
MENIELLLFESNNTDALPSKQVIGELSCLAKDFNLTYNVHLPTDISISSGHPDQQIKALDTIIEVIERVEPLFPSTLTLHVPFNQDASDVHEVQSWQDQVAKNLDKLLAVGIQSRLISIENLDYPFEMLEQIISDLDLGICLDLGHPIIHKYDIQRFYSRNSDRISIIHLYGVDQNYYHRGLNQLTPEFLDPVLGMLNKFKGSVSLEVFSFEDLKASLEILENHWEN